MEAESYFETLVTTYETRPCHNAEVAGLYIYIHLPCFTSPYFSYLLHVAFLRASRQEYSKGGIAGRITCKLTFSMPFLLTVLEDSG
jgi:hypothetical protein